MRDERSDTALLELCSSSRQQSVKGHLGHRNIIALEVHDRFHDVLCEVRSILRDQASRFIALGDL